ncbi:MAG: 5-(carboxyamino)imidazole ribonucleotide synthase [Flavobacteriia bacterium]|nr:5-(carboxyamino)imidazole ribonucleotide synthase [Flavobacteriia bacterium]OIP48638.1 MAG: 5-(carboxyamino)imidazole ribonucleotide synthase [Flavobacteriaceae bacterium CG2_30_31_66]PIV95591.1 MAG: 5-(carboxyamino)imidazole ribonucleotide synthase [Flavobacteriaceae bacterium CG17_big_fil_post_rev_8_21_14_2_50_31_13]PIX12377.1 MAG: 5-(carboxyamino)imidazole ribonucleotide synthase [Flavobacteriaceae bacterium CG_4_8_14_3_um_filter_31_8]PIY15970.1 MAG: 5-(carboxyamino)imidazole ribonucleoti
MKNYFSSNFTLGVLGGGQLGRMLLSETQKFDIFTAILDNDKNAPCSQICNRFEVGNLLDYESVYNFGKTVDLLTIEIENVNIDALEQLEKEGLPIFPKPQNLRIIQSKARQKHFYVDHQIPTAPFSHFAYIEELKHAAEHSALEFPFVWKAARFGYDGNGVKIVRNFSDLEYIPNVECITEKLIPFKNELAVIVARNLDGDIKTYPVVEMEFHPEANQVEYVICPARIDEKVAQKAQEIALKVVENLDFIGLLAVEMFQTIDDEILVNEVAPRPHNSGHYSIEASYTNQFEQHLRAILNLPLGNTESKVAGIMVNLVGEEGFSGQVFYENIEEVLQIDGVTPHIYGKKETRPYRKMGHVTIVNKDIDKAREIAQKVKETIRVIAK